MHSEPQSKLVLNGLVREDAFAAVVQEIRMPISFLRNVIRLLWHSAILVDERDDVVSLETNLASIEMQMTRVLELRLRPAGQGAEPPSPTTGAASVLTRIGRETAVAATRLHERVTTTLGRCDRNAAAELQPLLDKLPIQSAALVASVQQLLERDLVHYVNHHG